MAPCPSPITVALDDDDQEVKGQGTEASGGEGAEGAATQAATKPRRARDHSDYNPEATLSTAEALREKRLLSTFESDPLFNHTTKLFDENSATGVAQGQDAETHGCIPGLYISQLQLLYPTLWHHGPHT